MGAETENTTWPLPKFHFTVDFGAERTNISFQEVSGLETDTQVIEIRNGDSPILKMPGSAKFGHVIMKRGMFPNNSDFSEWINQMNTGTITTANIIVKLIDENGNVSCQWQLNNAFPTKIEGNNLAENGNEILVESIEVSFETMVISYS